jgi:hypothetical protein
MLARAGMSLCLRDLRADAGELLDLEGWVREKPWWMLGASATAGFAAGKFAFSGDADDREDGREPRKRPRGGSRPSALGALLGPLAAPLIGAAVAPLLRGFGAGPEDAPSPLEKLAFGRLWNHVSDRFR